MIAGEEMLDMSIRWRICLVSLRIIEDRLKDRVQLAQQVPIFVPQPPDLEIAGHCFSSEGDLPGEA
jgi:hypothetical protein